MRADPLLLTAGEWLGIAAGGLLLITVVAFVARWGFRFRLVGVTSFTVLLSLSCLAFAVSYAPRLLVDGAVSVPVVFDNGSDLVVAAAPADLAAETFGPSVEQVARNLRGSGRKDPTVEVCACAAWIPRAMAAIVPSCWPPPSAIGPVAR